jgi:hypothetical protein
VERIKFWTKKGKKELRSFFSLFSKVNVNYFGNFDISQQGKFELICVEPNINVGYHFQFDCSPIVLIMFPQKYY